MTELEVYQMVTYVTLVCNVGLGCAVVYMNNKLKKAGI